MYTLKATFVVWEQCMSVEMYSIWLHYTMIRIYTTWQRNCIKYYYGPYLDPLLSILQARVHIMDHLARFLLLLLL